MNETLKKVSLLGVAAPMLVSTWSGWVGLGTMCGFGIIQPFPGISGFELDTRITLPMGSEFYMVIGMSYAISRSSTPQVKRFAAWSTLFALTQSLAAQVAFHYMHALGVEKAPWGVIVAVSASLVFTLASAMFLYHLASEPEVVVEDGDEVADLGEVETTVALPFDQVTIPTEVEASPVADLGEVEATVAIPSSPVGEVEVFVDQPGDRTPEEIFADWCDGKVRTKDVERLTGIPLSTLYRRRRQLAA